jgi:hypothetical protein
MAASEDVRRRAWELNCRLHALAQDRPGSCCAPPHCAPPRVCGRSRVCLRRRGAAATSAAIAAWAGIQTTFADDRGEPDARVADTAGSAATFRQVAGFRIPAGLTSEHPAGISRNPHQPSWLSVLVLDEFAARADRVAHQDAASNRHSIANCLRELTRNERLPGARTLKRAGRAVELRPAPEAQGGAPAGASA